MPIVDSYRVLKKEKGRRKATRGNAKNKDGRVFKEKKKISLRPPHKKHWSSCVKEKSSTLRKTSAVSRKGLYWIAPGIGQKRRGLKSESG